MVVDHSTHVNIGITDAALARPLPLYGQRLLPHILRDEAKIDPRKPVALLFETLDLDLSKSPSPSPSPSSSSTPSSTSSSSPREVTTAELYNAVHATAWWIRSKLGHSDDFETLAYIGVSDLRYHVMHIASILCGYKLLCISIRNSDAGYLSLLEATSCTKFVCTSELMARGEHIRSLVGDRRLELVQLTSYQAICAMSTSVKDYPYDKTFAEAENDPILICHTSGSTGAPKPITLTNGNWAVVDNLRKIPKTAGRKNQDWSLLGFQNRDFFISSFPPFHATGMIAGMLPLMYNSIVVFPPPDRPATGESCLQMMRYLHRHHPRKRLRGLLVPPTVIEELVVEEDQGLSYASKLDFVMFTGGPLAPSVGDRLSEVTDICQLIGSTETGPIPGLVPSRKDWAYFEWQPFYKVDMEPRSEQDFELVLKQDPALRWIRTVAHTMPHVAVWNSSDLYRRHPDPDKPDLWRFHGRADDVVVLSNGEKFNPVPMEAIIQGHPLLKGALYYGQGRFQPALLVEPKSEVAGDKNDQDAFIHQIWPSIERANREAPQHARIVRDKMAVASPLKPFSRAAKGTVVRKLTLKDYAEELEALYADSDGDGARMESHSQSHTLLADPQDIIAVRDFVRKCLDGPLSQVQAPAPASVSDGQDLFSLGLDSLQTMELSKRLNAGLRAHLGAGAGAGKGIGIETKISPRHIYAHPTVAGLADLIYGLLNGRAESDSDSTKAAHVQNENEELGREAIMTGLIDKYTRAWRSSVSGSSDGDADRGITVMVTGTTGSLGTYLLLSLLKNGRTKHIYCLNRTEDAKDRQQRAFERMKADAHVDDPRLTFFRVDLGLPKFGLPADSFDRLQRETDWIVHNAWKVDFNQTVRSFEGPIAGVCGLVDFAKSSPRRPRPRLQFISSVSSVGNWSAIVDDSKGKSLCPVPVPVPETAMTDPRVAQHQGYGESKHVAEQILQMAVQECKIQAIILRVGQVGGPLQGGGCWNKIEWLPSLIQSSKALGLIPTGLPDVNWIPVDSLADIVVEIGMPMPIPMPLAQPTDDLQVFNLVNPQPVPWADLVPCIQAWFEAQKRPLQCVPLRLWIKSLQAIDVNDAEQVKAVPAVKIVGFFEAIADAGPESLSPSYVTRRGISCSPTMAKLAPVSPDWMRIWLGQWNF
ncbi:hypothetical protein A1O3_05225 [Capronia epimyces CBS 606.96]|uniref:Polyketide synthase-like phosphopantetheine-binding domain-containing protein n=1 Tax=Capronia epimyces CBS 606.96 TaxID=1182542 RepID=W9Y5Q8_9EURO|nr:uncharacterized protein A1O3_05225 [Capronia epimyces CBS 606.96]EXJ84556.1 hypothetical protein A1O3_05225 [Capronia epimyces CBS 606.96]